VERPARGCDNGLPTDDTAGSRRNLRDPTKLAPPHINVDSQTVPEAATFPRRQQRNRRHGLMSRIG